MKPETETQVNFLRESAEQIFRDWPFPNPYQQLNVADAVFAYRILLGRNPDLHQELPHLIWLSRSKPMKEIDWKEFKQDKLGNCNVVAKRLPSA